MSAPHPPSQEHEVDLFCVFCGYNLRHAARAQCPECGATIDYLEDQPSRLAWPRRRVWTSVQAYWATVWTVCVQPRRFATEYFRTHRYADANRFRWVSSALGSIALVTLFFPPFGPPGVFDMLNHIEFAMAVAGGVLVAMLFVAAAAQVSGLFFQTRNIARTWQDRGAVLSLYACAPVALGPLVCGAAYAAEVWARRSGHARIEMLCVAIRLTVPFATWVWWWAKLLKLGQALHQREGAALWRMILGIPLAWLAVGTIVGILLPAAVIFIAMVVISFVL